MRRGYKVKDAETRTVVRGEVFVRRVLWADSSRSLQWLSKFSLAELNSWRAHQIRVCFRRRCAWSNCDNSFLSHRNSHHTEIKMSKRGYLHSNSTGLGRNLHVAIFVEAC